MKKLFLIVVCCCLSGCGMTQYKSGATYTEPLGQTIDHAAKTTDQVYLTGAKPKDPQVHIIQTDLKQAQGQLIVVTKTLDNESKTVASATTTISAKNHRILIDDIIFAVPIAILVGMLGVRIASVFAL